MSDVFKSTAGELFGVNDAVDAMRKGIKKVKGVDIDALVEAARTRDTEKFSEQLELLAKADPRFAQLRDSGAEGLIRLVAADMEPSASSRAVDEMERISTADAPKLDSLVSGLIDRAGEEFAAGATLPPEFQAELVRAGLESAGRSGENLDPNSAAGVRIRRLVGSEGLALQRNREQAGLGMVGAASALQAARGNILQGLVGIAQGIQSNAASRAAGAAQLGQAAVPNVGVSGEDVGNLMVSNQALENQKRMALTQNSSAVTNFGLLRETISSY